MDTDSHPRQKVSNNQVNGLIEFLEEYPDLAKGINRGTSLKLWNLCARKLNSIGDGAKKDGKAWSRYWCDWKYRIRKKALEFKASKDSNIEVHEGPIQMTEIEEHILKLIGFNVVDDLIIIKNDPLRDEDSDEDLGNTFEESEIFGNQSSCKTRASSSNRRTRQNSTRNNSSTLDFEEHVEPNSPTNEDFSVNSHDSYSRQRISNGQLNGLIEFLEEYPDLAKGTNRGRRGKLVSLKLWNLCARKLNSMPDGAKKDGKAWSRYWCDWKCKVRKKAFELKASKHSNEEVHEDPAPMTDIEEQILKLIGLNIVDDVVIIIKNDPLRDEVSDGDLGNTFEESEIFGNRSSCETRASSSKRRKRRNSTRNNSSTPDFEDVDPNSPPKSKAKASSSEYVSVNSHGLSTEDRFLRLEEAKLENSRLIEGHLGSMSRKLSALVDVMGSVRDILLNNRGHDL